MPASVTAALSLLALVLAVAALMLATLANRRWAARSRQPGGPPVPAGHVPEPEAPAGPGPSASPAAPSQVQALAASVEALAGVVAELRRQVDEAAAVAHLPPQDPTALRHVALVRYDAFADVGGRLSYSLAVLDDTRSGLVLTTLAGKADVRTYVRAISAGEAEGTLTAEEQQAIEAAGRQA